MYIDGDDITCHQKSFPYIRQWVWDKKAATRENALCGLRTAFSAIKPLADTIKASDECEVGEDAFFRQLAHLPALSNCLAQVHLNQYINTAKKTYAFISFVSY